MQWDGRIGRKIKLRDLHILLAVVQAGSMAKAAIELAVSQPAGLILILITIPVFGADPIGADKLALAFGAGAASLGGLGAFYAAMAMGTVSVVAPIASLGVVVPVIVGLVQGDEPAAIQLVGLVAAIAGVVILSYE